MAQTGTVIPQGLNFRETPDGTIKGVLPQGTTVEIIEDQGDFLRIRVGGEVGFVKASLINHSDAPAAQPAVAGGGSFHFAGNDAVAPDGTVFGRRFKLGIFHKGTTSIGQFVSAHAGGFPNLSKSRLRVMEAVSPNEGNLEAINTYDNAFLSFGCFQWTCGTDSAGGELPSLIARLKQSDAAAFDELFGQFGLDVASVSSPPGQPPTGFFSLGGAAIKTAADKAHKLRTLERAFHFFKAGHDDRMRQAEVEHAASRIDLFYRDASHKILGRSMGDFATSEYGVALLLDEHVNRPGNVRNTLAAAVNQFISASGKNDPAVWNDQDERRLLEIYVQRRNTTSMTDSQHRADQIRAAVNNGRASDSRGSFQA